uniref:SSD domain-containing protein n=1 Tax=Chromera velia CCMP2878 TaxID=1169474 RepID=A0A0G4FK75_9ALVE|eukprot:Cvel_17453.t1-p1 / transcript=Cvel_17453.t1 / gene=Cvel_17453 / organism=Chromera_velia_CCMP2878 / gene_product=Protein patched homolog 2, putative / transcript_product=Protein patched homolog 2, putative / location=Cvel_scaffold1393:33386-39720(-) / protein_length=1053 / sequence_SO=supercontig / SO=protein_coding / is_pseudo=false
MCNVFRTILKGWQWAHQKFDDFIQDLCKRAAGGTTKLPLLWILLWVALSVGLFVPNIFTWEESANPDVDWLPPSVRPMDEENEYFRLWDSEPIRPSSVIVVNRSSTTGTVLTLESLGVISNIDSNVTGLQYADPDDSTVFKNYTDVCFQAAPSVCYKTGLPTFPALPFATSDAALVALLNDATNLNIWGQAPTADTLGLGGVLFNISSAEAAKIDYFVVGPTADRPDQYKSDRLDDALAWEQKMVDTFKDTSREEWGEGGGDLEIYCNFFRQTNDEVNTSISSVSPFIFISMGSLAFVCFLGHLSVESPEDSVGTIAILGLLGTSMAIFTSIGICRLAGVPFGPVTYVTLYVLLGFGVDDVFTVLSEYTREARKADAHEKSDREVVMKAVRNAGPAILVTSLINWILFALSALSTLPAIRDMCFYAVTAIPLQFLSQFFFLAPWLVLHSGSRKRGNCELCWRPCRRRQLEPVAGKKVEDREAEGGEGDQMEAGGGDHRESRLSNQMDMKGRQMSRLKSKKSFKAIGESIRAERFIARMVNLYAHVFTKTWFNVLVVCIFVAGWVGSAIGVTKLREAFPTTSFFTEDSSLDRYEVQYKRYFSTTSDTVKVSVGLRESGASLNWENSAEREDVLALETSLENLFSDLEEQKIVSWLRDFKILYADLVTSRPSLSFSDGLRATLSSNATFAALYGSSLKFSSTTGPLAISSFTFQLPKDLPTQRILRSDVQEMYKTIDDSPIRGLTLVAHGPLTFSFQDIEVVQLFYDNLWEGFLAISILCLVFVGDISTSLLVAVNLAGIVLGTVGFMGWYKIPIMATSYVFVCTMMGFPALVTFAYTFSHLVDPRLRGAKRVEQTVQVCGVAVFLAVLSNTVAVIPLRLTDSRIWHTVFQLILILTCVGLGHAMLLLPSLLALFRVDGRGFANWKTRRGSTKAGEKLDALNDPAAEMEEGNGERGDGEEPLKVQKEKVKEAEQGVDMQEEGEEGGAGVGVDIEQLGIAGKEGEGDVGGMTEVEVKPPVLEEDSQPNPVEHSQTVPQDISPSGDADLPEADDNVD